MERRGYRAKLHAVAELIRLGKQYGTALLLMPVMWSLFMASGGRPEPKLFFIFLVGSFLMRSAGCAVNDMADVGFDRLVERTMRRPVAQGRLKRWEAGVVFLVLSLLAFVLVLQCNRLTVYLSFGAIVFAALYPFVKRYTYFPQVFLGAAFGWGAVMAWAAEREEVAFAAIFIFIANIFYSTAYDTIYALMDKEDDLTAGVRSTAIYFGEKVYGTVCILYVFMALSLIVAGLFAGLGMVYFLSVFLALILFLLFTVSLQIRETKERFFSVFKLNAWVGAVVLVGIIIDTSFAHV